MFWACMLLKKQVFWGYQHHFFFKFNAFLNIIKCILGFKTPSRMESWQRKTLSLEFLWYPTRGTNSSESLGTNFSFAMEKHAPATHADWKITRKTLDQIKYMIWRVGVRECLYSLYVEVFLEWTITYHYHPLFHPLMMAAFQLTIN